MAQTGFTPIQIYSSTTAAAVPGASDLTNSALGSELAINITDGKLFYKDNANAVQVIGWKTVPVSAGGTGLTSVTSGRILYGNSATTLGTSANLTFDGTQLYTTQLEVGATTGLGYLAYIKGGNGNQLGLDNAGEQFTQIDLSNNGTTKGRVWLDNTNSEIVLQGASSIGAAIYTNATKRINITSAGLVSLENSAGLSINKIAVSSPAAGDGNVFSGLYTPTLTNSTNVAASTTGTCQYMRVGSAITVSGQFTVDPTAAGTLTVLLISLPIASNFTSSRSAGGTVASASNIYGEVGAIIGNTASDVFEVRLLPSSAANQTYAFQATYYIE
jgi:hypothetical protein